MESKFKIGQAVATKHGKGVIDNYELVNDASVGRTPVMVLSGRYGVKLDEGHTWAIKGKIAYYYTDEIQAI